MEKRSVYIWGNPYYNGNMSETYENPLSLRVAGSGTKKPVTTYVVSAF